MPHFVTLSEAATGIVLNPDGTRFLGKGEHCLHFESEQAALDFVRLHLIDHPQHECWLADEPGGEGIVFRLPLTCPLKDG